MKKTVLRFLSLLCAMALGLCLGYGSYMLGQYQAQKQALAAPNSAAYNPKFPLIQQVYNALLNDYYEELDSTELIEAAIRGMLELPGDPYTFYYTADEWKNMLSDSAGEYGGLGILILEKEDMSGLLIVRVFRDSPAEKAGLRSGDIIIAADGYSVPTALKGDAPDSYEGPRNTSELIMYMRGEIGTDVELTLLRDGEEIKISVTRDTVHENRVEYYVIAQEGKPDVGYIELTQFEGDAVQGIKNAVDYFEEQNVGGMILDLRNNPGGDLNIVVEIANTLLPETMVCYLEDRHGNRDTYYSYAGCWGKPLTILINENSASASELLTGVSQDIGAAKVVGVTSFGKGIAQTLQPMIDGSAFQMTVARYYTPSGRVVQGNGIAPDIEVELNEDYSAAAAVDLRNSGDFAGMLANDSQLNAAYDTVVEMIASGWVLPVQDRNAVPNALPMPDLQPDTEDAAAYAPILLPRNGV